MIVNGTATKIIPATAAIRPPVPANIIKKEIISHGNKVYAAFDTHVGIDPIESG